MNNSASSNGSLITNFFRHETQQNSFPGQTKSNECCIEDGSEQTNKIQKGGCVISDDILSSIAVEEGEGAVLGKVLKDAGTSDFEDNFHPSSGFVTPITSSTSFNSAARTAITMTQSVLSLDGKGGWVVSSACDSSYESQETLPAVMAASDNESTKREGPQSISHSPLEEPRNKNGGTTADLSQKRRRQISKNRSIVKSKPSSDSSNQPTEDAVVTSGEDGSSCQQKRRSNGGRRSLVTTDQDKTSIESNTARKDPRRELSDSPVTTFKRSRKRRKSSMIVYSSSDEENEADDCMVVGSSGGFVPSEESRLENDLDLSCGVDEASTVASSSHASTTTRKPSSMPLAQSSSSPGPLTDSWAAIFRQPCASSSKDLQVNGKKRQRSSPIASPKKASSPVRHWPHNHSPQRYSPLKGSPLLRKLRMVSQANLKEGEQNPPPVKKQLSFSPNHRFDCAPYFELLHVTQSCHADIQSLFSVEYPHLRVKSISSSTSPPSSSLRLGSVTMATEALPPGDVVVEVRINR